jgi:hypothetical protein
VAGINSSVQTQLDGKQAVVANVSDTEIGYLDGVTSSIQSQLNNITVTAGTLTKSFLSGETSDITLSSSLTCPVVSVIKEVPQEGVSSKGAWDVASDGGNYSVHNTATSTTLTIGSTLSLSSGSFASSDVGKKIYVDDGGEAVLTATDGSFKLVSAFNDSSYTSGNWSMSSVDVDSSSGLTLNSAFVGEFDITTASASQNLDISSQSSNSGAITFKSDGTMLFVTDSNGGIHRYDLATPWNVYGATYHSSAYTASQGGLGGYGSMGIAFKPDGTKFFVNGRSSFYRVMEYSLSTAWDMSTYSYIRSSSSITAGGDIPNGITFKPDGTQFFTVSTDGGRRFSSYSCATPWDISSISHVGNSSYALSTYAPDGETVMRSMSMSPDGLRVFTVGENNQRVYQFSVSPAWSVSNFTYVANLSIPSNVETNLHGVFVGNDGKSLYINGRDYDRVYQYDLGSLSMPLNQYAVSVTGGGQIDTTYWTDINGMTADETVGDGEIYYAVSTDNHVTWSVIHDTNGVRPIVRNNSSTWQYNSNATYGGTTWSNSTTNDELSALKEALSANASNRMNSTQLNAVTDANHYTLADSLDLMIALNQTTASSNLPSSDGVSINYNAATLIKGAVLGEDYDYDFPSSTTVRVTSNATQNLKVRVV